MIEPPAVTVPVVLTLDRRRSMGIWPVNGVFPTSLESEIYYSVESPEFALDGTISTTFTFYKGAFAGSAARMRPGGFVITGSNKAVSGEVVRVADQGRVRHLARRCSLHRNHHRA